MEVLALLEILFSPAQVSLNKTGRNDMNYGICISGHGLLVKKTFPDWLGVEISPVMSRTVINSIADWTSGL